MVGILEHVTFIWKKGEQIFKMFFDDGQSMWLIANKNKNKIMHSQLINMDFK
jgi:hypothetical protein